MIALVAAYLTRRSVRNLSGEIEAAQSRISIASRSLGARTARVRGGLVGIGTRADALVAQLSDFDARTAVAVDDLHARRAASDSLRGQLTGGHATLNRVRDVTRLVMRAIELRRVFLG